MCQHYQVVFDLSLICGLMKISLDESEQMFIKYKWKWKVECNEFNFSTFL
jgi:hypothetical protein